MMLTCMTLSLVSAALLGLTGVLVEWAALAYRRAARWGWIAVLLASALLSIGGPVSLSLAARTGRASPPANPPGDVAPAAGVAAVISARVTPALGALADAGRGLDTLLMLTWILSSLGCFASLALAHRTLRRERRRWPRAVFDRDVVRVSEDLGPAVVGFRSPEIVVPAWVLDMDAESRRLIACHEREHLAAGDQQVVLVGLLAVVLAPWNPLLWWQLRRLRLAIEIDCDRRALGTGVGMREYGNLLIALGRRSTPLPAPVAPLAEGGSALVRRVRALTRSAPRWRAMRASVAVTGASLLAGVVSTLPAPPARSPAPGARPGGVYRATLDARQLQGGTPRPANESASSSASGRTASFMVRQVPAGTLRARSGIPPDGSARTGAVGRYTGQANRPAATSRPSPSSRGGAVLGEVRAHAVPPDSVPDRAGAQRRGGTLRPVRATAVRSPRDTLLPRLPE